MLGAPGAAGGFTGCFGRGSTLPPLVLTKPRPFDSSGGPESSGFSAVRETVEGFVSRLASSFAAFQPPHCRMIVDAVGVSPSRSYLTFVGDSPNSRAAF